MLSIIICTLNEEHYLPKLLESFWLQTAQFPYEVIVVDAGSTDDTEGVVKRFQQYFRVPLTFVPFNQKGIARQRNEGAKLANFERLLFLDADVVLPNDFLHNAFTEINTTKTLVAGTQIFAAEKNISFRLVYWTYSNTYYKIVRWFNPVIHGCSIFVTKTIHDKIGGFKEGIMFEDFKYGSDAAAFSRPRLLKTTFVRTSARRFYNTTPSSIWELVRGAAKSFFKSELKNDEFTAFHELTGKHELPKY